jgi:hypothetical protein
LRRGYEHCWFNIRDRKMKEHWTFEKFLEFAESYGYTFICFWNPYRIFVNKNEPEELPWFVPVYERKIDIEYVKKFKKWLKSKGVLRDEDEEESNGS